MKTEGNRITYKVRQDGDGTYSVLDPENNILTSGIAEKGMAEQEAACLSDAAARHVG
jgi:hypothetical protein